MREGMERRCYVSPLPGSARPHAPDLHVTQSQLRQRLAQRLRVSAQPVTEPLDEGPAIASIASAAPRGAIGALSPVRDQVQHRELLEPDRSGWR